MFRNRLSRKRRSSWAIIPTFCLLCGHLPAAAQELKEFDTDYLQSPVDGPDLQKAERAIVRLTNEFRRENGLEKLKTDDKLHKAASYFVAFMARTNKYGHEADGNQPWERVALFGYDYCVVAENIAYQMKSTDFETKELAGKFFDGWKESPPHRKNMLQPHVTETGVAIGHAPGSDRYFAVQLFARPQSDAIQFQVTNLTDETIHYTVGDAKSHEEEPEKAESDRQTFELPPRATMSHTRCLPARIDWGWTKDDDGVNVSGNGAYMITKSANGGIEVMEQPAAELEVRPEADINSSKTDSTP
ncbi:MAG TPA: CAP domain-containing protein [Lacipirellulaceae bacterium]|nr:CAP domain-containing protein [Lacipirellulaceae bacterium]